MTGTIAKFRVDETTRHNQMRSVKQPDGTYKAAHEELHTYVLHAVYGDEPGSENKAFWDATPQGEIRLSVVRPHGVFELGQELYVTFSLTNPALVGI